MRRRSCSGRTLLDSARIHVSSTAATDYSHFSVGIAIGALLFERGFAKLEDLGVVHVGNQILRFFAEHVDILRQAQVVKEGFLVQVALDLLDQLLDLVFTCCIVLLFDCGKGYARNSVIHGVVPGFPGTLRFAGLVPR